MKIHYYFSKRDKQTKQRIVKLDLFDKIVNISEKETKNKLKMDCHGIEKKNY